MLRQIARLDGNAPRPGSGPGGSAVPARPTVPRPATAGAAAPAPGSPAPTAAATPTTPIAPPGPAVVATPTSPAAFNSGAARSLSAGEPLAASPTVIASSPAQPITVANTSPVSAAPVAAAIASVPGGQRRPLSQPAPVFPREALRDGVAQGRVLANLAVGPDGRVSEVTVLSATPSRAFGRAAQQALRDWRYEPAAGPSSVQVEVVFRAE